MKQSVYNMVKRLLPYLPVTRSICAENEALRAAFLQVNAFHSALHDDAGLYRQHAAGLPPDFDIIMPVCNAAPWLEAICDAHAALGLTPLYIIDQRSSDASLDILQRRRARIMEATGSQPYAESLLLGILPALKAKWVMRLDDDELPSVKLLEYIRTVLPGLSASMVGMPRHWVMQAPEGWLRTRAEPGKGIFGADYQYRLFQPRLVQPTHEVHSPGYTVENAVDGPIEAALYHFDWVVRSHAERQKKVNRYDAQQPGIGAKCAPFYLPEDHALKLYDFEALTDAAVLDICVRLASSAHL